MTRKPSKFDIDLPEQDPVTPQTGGTGPRIRDLDGAPPPRRGPMAAAISENAGALATRAAAEAAIRAENDALAHEFVALQKAGLVLRMIPLDDVETYALVRDRVKGDDPELHELVTSIRDVGLSNPIRVAERPDGRYELVQGWRRLNAYRVLLAEDGAAWATIPAGILPRGEDIGALYRRMLDENIVRKDLSFAEMAMAAQAYAADPETDPTNTDDAVAELFKSANYSKRSYIRAFARLLDQIGKYLDAPQDLPRALGLTLLRRIEEQSLSVARIRAALERADGAPQVEVLRDLAERDDTGPAPVRSAAPGGATGAAGARRARTTFDMRHTLGRARCTAGIGQITVKLDRDFTADDRRKLEQGIARLLDSLL